VEKDNKLTYLLAFAAILLVLGVLVSIPFLISSQIYQELGRVKQEDAHEIAANSSTGYKSTLLPTPTAPATRKISDDALNALISQTRAAFKELLGVDIPADFVAVSGRVGTVAQDGTLTVIVTLLPPDWNLASLVLAERTVPMYTATFAGVNEVDGTATLEGLDVGNTRETDESSETIYNAIRMDESADRGANRNRDTREALLEGGAGPYTQEQLNAMETTARQFAAEQGFSVNSLTGYSTSSAEVEFTFSDENGRTMTVTVSKDGTVNGFGIDNP
jgi:hypothetical protein